MENVPKMISTKDLAYIEDIFNWNLTTAKVVNCYSKKVQDEEIKNFFEALYEGHKNICQDLISILNGEENYGE